MVFGIPGTEAIGGIDLNSIISSIGKIAIIIFMFILVAAIWGVFYWKRKNKNVYTKKIFWFEEIHGHMVPTDEDIAKEIKIPGTNITVFYIKKKDMYLPRLVRKMGKDAYWLAIRKNREIVNFSMTNINEEMKEAKLDYDHTDQRYALSNLLDLIKRNYKDKAVPWWREYKDVISVVILIFVLTLSFFFLFSKVGGLIDRVGILIDHADKLIQAASKVTPGSGVLQA